MSRLSRLLDLFSFVLSLALVGATVYLLWRDRVFAISFLESDNPVWYLIRSAGVTAYALLTVSVIWGLFLTSHILKDWCPGPLSMALHSTLSWLAMGFGLAHGLLLMADSYVPFRLLDVLVPFTAPYRPVAVGLGVIAFWLVFAVTLSFPAKRRLGHRLWKLLHLSSYVAFFLGVGHALLAGTDIAQPGFRLLILAGLGLVLLLSAYRVARARGSGGPSGSRRGGAAQRQLDVKGRAAASPRA